MADLPLFLVCGVAVSRLLEVFQQWRAVRR